MYIWGLYGEVDFIWSMVHHVPCEAAIRKGWAIIVDVHLGSLSLKYHKSLANDFLIVSVTNDCMACSKVTVVVRQTKFNRQFAPTNSLKYCGNASNRYANQI
jgi:hypothetical protein